ncbi:MAG: YdcF family protein [Candidatus Solibacter usitatus]|nr:YdcF family protein [Candidatus Solibacter usitatus]
MKRLFSIAILLAVLAAAGYLLVTARTIERYSRIDEARKADVIVVLGAAEYNGRPSPVLQARLDHALDLYRRELAAYVLTTGGAGGDRQFTEGQVGRDYLVRRGVPAERIVVEAEGDSTVRSLIAAGQIMNRMGLKSAVVVSDGYHIFRAKRILEDEGVTAYGSPRPHAPRGTWQERWLYLRQAVGYMLWRAGINL